MTWQRFSLSRAAHSGRLASSVFGVTRWWGMVGALVLVGVTTYLFTGSANDQSAINHRLSDLAGAHSITDAPRTAASAPTARLPSMAGRWQNLPLLAAQQSADFSLSGEVKALALQVAFERERVRADAAQRQLVPLQEQVASLVEQQREVAGIQEQLADLKGKQEEVIVLRERLAEADANTRRVVEHLRAVIEEKERADKALLRVTASHEQLDDLRASVVEAQKAAESEKQKATSALEELEAVKGQLAAARREAASSLREQHASLEASEAQITEHRRAAVEEKKRAEDALAEAAASYKELENSHKQLDNLKARVVAAWTAAASERQSAISALEQLEVVKGQLAARTASESDREETASQLHQNQEHIVIPFLNSRRELLPATRIFQVPLPLEAVTASPGELGKDEERATRQKSRRGTMNDKARQVSLESAGKTRVRPDNDTVTAPIPSGRNRTEPEATKISERRREARHQSVQPVEKPSPGAGRPGRLPTQDASDDFMVRNPDALGLPSALLPDSRLW
ncbi:hypothetical protein [Microvirga arabica]|uniref:hypothetical protein n=1 Tax=Microvirga arabica TaxID=1128671 RepID=UPI00193A5B6C|nr:hypothetical protein [Microvirga arabica]MBM1175472.1 hypothetical protein [Microvirga arabica]